MAGTSHGQLYLLHNTDDRTARLVEYRVRTLLSEDRLQLLALPALTRGEVQFNSSDIVVAFGLSVYREACRAEPRGQTIVAMSLGEDEYRQTTPCRSPATAIFVGAPLEKRIQLLKQVWPNESKIGVLYGDKLALAEEEYSRLAKKYDLEMLFYKTTVDKSSVIRTLNNLLSQTSVILSVPDSRLYNAELAQDILRLLFRQRKVMIGPSLNFVKAGALYAIYTDFDQQLMRLGEVLDELRLPGPLPDPSYPAQLKVSFNPYLIRSLGIVLPTQEFLFNQYGLCPESGCAETPN